MPVAHAPDTDRVVAMAAANRTERAIVRVINRHRRRYRLPRLVLSPRLTFAAGLHAFDLSQTGRISHAGSDGSTPAGRVLRVTRARRVGETIVAQPRGASMAPRTVVRLWLRSPSHRAQLLSRRYRRVGVARARGPVASVITANFASAR